jgi:hypothetical protein
MKDILYTNHTYVGDMFTRFRIGAVSVIRDYDGLYLGKIVLLCRSHWAAHAFDGQTACVSRISRDDHCERVLTVGCENGCVQPFLLSLCKERVLYTLSCEWAPYCQWAYTTSHGEMQVSQSFDASRASIDRRCYRRLPRRCGSTTGTIDASIQQSNSYAIVFNGFKHVGLIN